MPVLVLPPVPPALPPVAVVDGWVVELGSSDEQAAAWAAALVLIAFVLVMNVLAKVFAGRKRRKLEGL